METFTLRPTDPAVPEIHLEVSSELMKNQAPGSAIDPGQRMVAVETMAGDPMLFAIGNDGVLRVILRSPFHRQGWDCHPLTTELGSSLRAVTFDAAQLVDGRIVLAVAMAPANAPNKTSLYVTAPLANDPTLTDWATVGQGWVQRGFPEDSTVIDIRIGAGTKDALPLGVVSARKGEVPEQYLINIDAHDRSWSHQLFELPENATGPVVLAPGVMRGDRGVYALYDTSAGQSLVFSSLPDPIYHKSSHYELVLPARVRCIAALASASDSSDVYVAGDGLHAFPGSAEHAVTIAAKGQLPSVHEMFVRQGVHNTAVFALAGDQRVFHAEGPTANLTGWPPPMQIMSGVSHVAMARTSLRSINRMFTAAGNKLSCLYQDAESRLWKEMRILLPATDRIAEFISYTTHVRATDAQGRPLSQLALGLRAESWTYVVANGQLQSVAFDEAAEIATDLNGSLTVLMELRDVSAPVLYLTSAGSHDVAALHPTSKVRARLEAVNSLADESLHDGSMLVAPGSASPESLEGVKGGLDELLRVKPGTGRVEKLRRSLAAGGKPVLRAGRGGELDLSLIPEGHSWGMTFASGEARYFRGEAPANVYATALGATSGDIFDWATALVVQAGDALEWVTEQVAAVARFVCRKVGDALEYMFQLGEQVFKFVIEGVEQAFRLIGWVLKKTLGVDLEKFCQWLGFVFDWGDIVRTHKIIVRMAEQVVTISRSNLSAIGAKVPGFFEDLKAKLRTIAPRPDGDQPLKPPVAGAGEAKAQELERSPAASWGEYHLLHSGVVDGKQPGPVVVSDPFSAFVSDVLVPALDSVKATAQRLGKDFHDAFLDGSLTMNQLIVQLASDAGIGLLDVVERIAVGVLKFIDELIGGVYAATTSPIQIPFFSAFYKHTIADSELSIMDLMALLLAIPTTIGYKAITGVAPFPPGPTPFETADAGELLRLLRGAPVTATLGGAASTGGGKSYDLAKSYSQWGGFVYSFAAAIGDAFGTYSTYMDTLAIELEASPGESTPLLPGERTREERLASYAQQSYWCDMVRVACGFMKAASGMPVGSRPEVNWQWSVWSTYLGSTILEIGLLSAVRKKRWTALMMNMVKGTLKLIVAVLAFGFENVAYWNYEREATDLDQADVVAKYIQNTFYFIADGAGAFASFMAASPAKAGLYAASVLPMATTVVINVARVVLNVTNNLPHHNY